MELNTYFNDFIYGENGISLTNKQRQDCISGHKILRKRLLEYEGLKDIIITIFLQGSYARSTIVRPKGDENPDVDVVVVTNLNEEEYTPDQAMDLFIPFMEKYYSGKYKKQGRSIGIKLSYVDLDLVITSAPSETESNNLTSILRSAEKQIKSSAESDDIYPFSLSTIIESALKDPYWKAFPLRIPDRELKNWQDTHPLAQAQWTQQKNQRCNYHYLNVVKAIKWWRKENYDGQKPKGYPLEHIVGYCCPDNITSIAEGVTFTFENIVRDFSKYALAGQVPFLPNHGIPDKNVLERISAEEFAAFIEQVKEAASVARKAFDSEDKCESAELWGDLFGSKFPQPDPDECDDDKGRTRSGGYTKRAAATSIAGGRFA